MFQHKISSNALADCLSRLTRKIREAQHFPLSDPILAKYVMVKKIKAYKDKIETDDPWGERLASAAMEDTDYVTMIQHIELGTEPKDIPKDCELADMSGDWGNLSVLTIAMGQSLILKHNCEILVPKKERVNILNIAHKTHLGHESMVTQ